MMKPAIAKRENELLCVGETDRLITGGETRTNFPALAATVRGDTGYTRSVAFRFRIVLESSVTEDSVFYIIT